MEKEKIRSGFPSRGASPEWDTHEKAMGILNLALNQEVPVKTANQATHIPPALLAVSHGPVEHITKVNFCTTR